jgi:hypothetical protein
VAIISRPVLTEKLEKEIFPYEIWGSQGTEDVADSLQNCDAVQTCRWVTTFQSEVLSKFSALKMEAVYPFETLVPTYKSTRRHNPEGYQRQDWRILYGKIRKDFHQLLFRNSLKHSIMNSGSKLTSDRKPSLRKATPTFLACLPSKVYRFLNELHSVSQHSFRSSSHPVVPYWQILINVSNERRDIIAVKIVLLSPQTWLYVTNVNLA